MPISTVIIWTCDFCGATCTGYVCQVRPFDDAIASLPDGYENRFGDPWFFDHDDDRLYCPDCIAQRSLPYRDQVEEYRNQTQKYDERS